MQTVQFKDVRSVCLVENAIQKECSLIRIGIRNTRRNLESFEAKYRMTSEAFYEKYQNGETDDDLETMRWAAEFRALAKLTGDHHKLSLKFGCFLCRPCTRPRWRDR